MRLSLIFSSYENNRCDSDGIYLLKAWRRSGVFIVNFENSSHLVLVFLLLTLNMKMPAGESGKSGNQFGLSFKVKNPIITKTVNGKRREDIMYRFLCSRNFEKTISRTTSVCCVFVLVFYHSP